MTKFESMEDMARRLAGTGGGDQAKAVIDAAKLIRSAPGMLDSNNRVAAIYHLAVALAGVDHAASTIETAAFLLKDED